MFHLINKAFENAWRVFLPWTAITLIYWFAKLLLSIEINHQRKPFTMKGKLITLLYCFFGSLIAPLILFFSEENTGIPKSTALSYFIIIFITSLVARYNCYKSGAMKTVSHEETPF